jgi:hypothetical protein
MWYCGLCVRNVVNLVLVSDDILILVDRGTDLEPSFLKSGSTLGYAICHEIVWDLNVSKRDKIGVFFFAPILDLCQNFCTNYFWENLQIWRTIWRMNFSKAGMNYSNSCVFRVRLHEPHFRTSSLRSTCRLFFLKKKTKRIFFSFPKEVVKNLFLRLKLLKSTFGLVENFHSGNWIDVFLEFFFSIFRNVEISLNNQDKFRFIVS